MPICRKLFRHEVRSAFALAFAKAGSNMAARIAMIAMTTSSSMSVKPCRQRGARAAEVFDKCMGLFDRPLPRAGIVRPSILVTQGIICVLGVNASVRVNTVGKFLE